LICALCGKELEEKPSNDHFYPRAICKWMEPLLSPKKFRWLKNLIYNPENIIYTHDSCNKEKEDFKVEVSDLYLPEGKKQALRRIGKSIAPYAKQYAAIKAEVYQRQGPKCYCCGEPLPLSRAVMRRIDSERPRVQENACLVCHICNHRYEEFQ
jgi:hypothetical protein